MSKPKVKNCERLLKVKELVAEETALCPDVSTETEVPEEWVGSVGAAFRVKPDVAKDWLVRVKTGETSCGRDVYGKTDLCASCYRANLDRHKHDAKYNPSDKGLARRKKYRQSKSWKESVDRYVSKRRSQAQLLAEEKIEQEKRDFFERYGESALAELEARQRIVLTRALGLDGNRPETYEQIGTRLGCSKQNVSTIKKKAIAALEKLR